MIVTIHQPQYMPWLGYFEKAHQADIFVLLDNVQYKKNEWQNRNRVRTAQGWQWLTVPVTHGFGERINEIKINNAEPWRKKHLKSLEVNYAKAPFFSRYFPYFEDILKTNWTKLHDVNIYAIKKIIEILGIKTKVVLASEYEAVEHKTLRLIDLCKHFGATTYLSGEGGLQYLDVEQFKANHIELLVQKYEHPVYPQLYGSTGEFISHLSVIDLLFNCGPESLKILTGPKLEASP